MSLTTKNTTTSAGLDGANAEALLNELTAIRAELIANPVTPRQHLDEVHANYQASARNLLHYLALRRRDLRRCGCG